MIKNLFLRRSRWTVDRMVFSIAGTFIVGSVLLGHTVHAGFLFFTGFVGLMMINYAFTGLCPMAFFLKKLGFPER